MLMDNHTAGGYAHESESSLTEEIAMLESRLAIMGLDGDCAYERALSQVYHSLLTQRRSQLAALRTSSA